METLRVCHVPHLVTEARDDPSVTLPDGHVGVPLEAFHVRIVLPVQLGGKHVETVRGKTKPSIQKEFHAGMVVLSRTRGHNVKREEDSNVVVEFLHVLESVAHAFVAVDQGVVDVDHDGTGAPSFVLELDPMVCVECDKHSLVGLVFILDVECRERYLSVWHHDGRRS